VEGAQPEQEGLQEGRRGGVRGISAGLDGSAVVGAGKAQTCMQRLHPQQSKRHGGQQAAVHQWQQQYRRGPAGSDGPPTKMPQRESMSWSPLGGSCSKIPAADRVVKMAMLIQKAP
jgi:hypothetical protein